MGRFLDIANAAWLGTALGAISISVAIYFYFKSKRTKRISYQTTESSLAGGANSLFPDQLQIMFAGIAVPRVTGTRLIIWNSGTETINGDQIVHSDPFCISLPEDSQILQANIVKQTRDVIAASCKISRNKVFLSFEFLDSSDGFSVEVIHSSAKTKQKIEGTIKGIPNGFSRIGYDHVGEADILVRVLTQRGIFRNTMLIVGAALTLFGVFYDTIIAIAPNIFEPDIISARWPVIILGCIYLLGWGMQAARDRKPYPKSLTFEPSETKPETDSIQEQRPPQ